MGNIDIILKEYISDNARFADAVNAIIYNGEQVVKEDELVDVESELQNTRSNNRRRDIQKGRDIVKKIGNDAVYMIMAVELGKVFGFLRNCSSKKELLGYIEKNKEMYTNIDIKTAELIYRLRKYAI